MIFNGKEIVGSISPLDRSFALGDGLFETIKVVGGRAVWLDEHLERMFNSARFAGIVCALAPVELSDACVEFIGNEKIIDGFLRITMSRGETATGRFSEMPQTGTLVITGGDSASDMAYLRAGFGNWNVNENDPSVYHKTTSRFSSVLAFRVARERGLDELVYLNSNGMVTEGIVSNIFWFKDGVLKTPSVECGLLGGVARSKVLRAALALGIRTETGAYLAETLRDADGMFFTNSLWVIRACDEFDGKRYSDVDNIILSLKDSICNGL